MPSHWRYAYQVPHFRRKWRSGYWCLGAVAGRTTRLLRPHRAFGARPGPLFAARLGWGGDSKAGCGRTAGTPGRVEKVDRPYHPVRFAVRTRTAASPKWRSAVRVRLAVPGTALSEKVAVRVLVLGADCWTDHPFTKAVPGVRVRLPRPGSVREAVGPSAHRPM